MQVCFAAPVKFYSTYSELIAAPMGFETAFAPLQPSKWQHFPADLPSELTFSIDVDKICHVVVMWNGRTMETIKVNLIESARIVQFTALCPAISCKYIILTESGMFVRRFQVSLGCNEDFEKLQAVLAGLRLSVKPARVSPTVSNFMKPNPDHSRLSNFSNSSASATECKGLAASPSNENFSAKNSLLESQYVAKVPEEEFRYPICSQVISDTQVQSQYGSNLAAASSQQNLKTRAEVPPFLSTTIYPLPTAVFPGNDFPERPLNRKHQSQYRVLSNEPSLIDRLVKSKNSKVEFTDQESRLVPNAVGGTMKDVAHAIPEKNHIDINACSKKDATVISQLFTDQNSKVDEIVLEEICEKSPNTTDFTKFNVLNDQGNIPFSKTVAKEKKKPEPINKGKQPCDQLSNIQPAANCQKIKISKRAIKAKLKDEYFMKWVAKVEETLSVMKDFQRPSGQECSEKS